MALAGDPGPVLQPQSCVVSVTVGGGVRGIPGWPGASVYVFAKQDCARRLCGPLFQLPQALCAPPGEHGSPGWLGSSPFMDLPAAAGSGFCPSLSSPLWLCSPPFSGGAENDR